MKLIVPLTSLLVLLLVACAPQPQPTPTGAVTVLETPMPGSTHEPTMTPEPLPTLTFVPTFPPVAPPQTLGVSRDEIQLVFEGFDIQFSETVVGGLPALEGMDPDFPEVTYLLVGLPDDLRELHFIFPVDSELVYVSLQLYGSLFLEALGTPEGEIEPLIDEIYMTSVDALNAGRTSGLVQAGELQVSFEILETDRLSYIFLPSP